MKEPKDDNFKNPKQPLDLELCKQIMSLYPYSKLIYLEKVTSIIKNKENENKK